MFKQQGVVGEEIYLTAIDNTNKMADSVESFELDTSFKYPPLYDDDVKETSHKLSSYVEESDCNYSL